MPKSPKEMQEAIIRNLPQKTGKTLGEWVKVLHLSGLVNPKEQVAWLKREHHLGHVTAHIVAEAAQNGGVVRSYLDLEALVEAMYAGPKEALRPAYEELLKVARKLGPDVKVSPCKTYVSLVRNRQFALVKPTTRTRIDVGLVLPGVKPVGRLRATSRSLGSGERITHWIAVSTSEDVDYELRRWLTTAYQQDEEGN